MSHTSSHKPTSGASRIAITRLLELTPWILAAATAATLLANVPSGDALGPYALQLFAYGALTALALVFGVLLTEGELSPAHIIGLVGFLSLPAGAMDGLLWAIFLGGIAGGSLLAARDQVMMRVRRRKTTGTLENVLLEAARVTLSFFVARRAYLALGGSLPVPHVDQVGAGSLLVSAAAFSLTYVTIYFAIFALELYADGRPVVQVIRTNAWVIVAVLLVPIPFGVLAADVAKNSDVPGFALLVIGLALVISVLHAYSRSEFRLRVQLDELRSLSVVTQAMRAHLNLDTLLKTIYLQVANLLDTDNFLVALYDPEDKMLDFPLVIRNGVQEERFQRQRDTLDTALLNRVLQTRAPLLLSDEVYEQVRRLGLRVPREMVYSWLGVPLLAGGNILGGMVVSSREPHQHFTPDDLRLLNIVAASASIAVENAQLYQRQTERANRLSTLNNISSLLAGTLSPESVLDTIISSVSTISGANAVAVFLLWEETQAAPVLARSAGLSDRFSTDPAMPILAEKEYLGTLHKQPPVVVQDAAKDRRALPYQAVMTREGKSAWSELPLTVGESRLGILVAYYNDPQTHDGEAVELLRTFASQAAQAINNARLYASADKALERRVEQLFALAAMGRLLTATMDLRQIADVVLGYATDATKANAGLVALHDELTDRLEIVSQRGYPESLLKDPAILLQGVTGRVLASGEQFRSDDVRKEPGYMPLLQSTRSQLIVPIMRGRETLGAIRVESGEANAFTEEDSYFLGQIANQTVIAINNARLFQRITEARDRLQVLLNAMEEAIVLIDNRGQIALANPHVEQLIALKPSLLIDRNISALLEQPDLKLAERMGFSSDESLRQLIQNIAGVWKDAEPVFYGVQAEHGMLYIQRQVIPIRDDTGKPIGALLVFYNKTEEHELARAREELSQMIVHDLRSPLTAVTTSLRLLREIVPSESDFRPVVDSTTDASQRAIRKLLSRVDALLDISKMESDQLNLDAEPSELATIVDSVCVELSALAHELNVKVASEVGESLPLLDIDADKVERLLLNLVDNALKYSPANSTITIRAHPPGAAGASEHFLRVEVADRGPGIPNEYKARLFDRFVQIEGRRKVRRGVGLGLTFCKLVAEAHGGRIWIEDNPGGGSIFAFTLPVARPGLPTSDDDELPVKGALPGGI